MEPIRGAAIAGVLFPRPIRNRHPPELCVPKHLVRPGVPRSPFPVDIRRRADYIALGSLSAPSGSAKSPANRKTNVKDGKVCRPHPEVAMAFCCVQEAIAFHRGALGM